MTQLWNEIQPVDSYQVKLNGILDDFDRKVITFLYQPLIGSTCFSLYMTLWGEVEENRLWSKNATHYHLMNFLMLNLREIYNARLKLEGIGLLKTYIHQNGEERSFLYELQPPLSPEQFFTDGMLNIYLYRKIGQSHFTRLKRFFSDRKISKEQFVDITRGFQDVYESADQNVLLDQEGNKASELPPSEQYYSRKAAGELKITGHHFDFELLMAGLKEVLIPQRAITPQVKEGILKLSYLYNINAVEMKNIVLSALTEEQIIDIDELRKAARDWYQIQHGNDLPLLVDRVQPVLYREASPKLETKKEKLVHYLETTSPRQLLIDISDGAHPSKADLQAIEEIAFQQKLPFGVINVLVHYVMLRTDMKLSKNYLGKIASHWARKKVKTVTEAMELAKQEHRQYQEWAAHKKSGKLKKKAPIRTEKLPDWFKENYTDVNNKAKKDLQHNDTESLESKRRRLQQLKKKYQK